jgi:hypothetical protein
MVSVPESQFSKRGSVGHLTGKGDSGLLCSGIDEIPESHLMESKKSGKVSLFRQSYF